AVIDGGAPERLPGVRLELAPDLRRRPVEEPLAVLALPERLLFRGRLVLQPLVGVAVAAGRGPAAPAAEVVDQLVAGDGVQPAAEGAAARVVLQLLRRPGHGAQH